eukprot:PhM_4_TR14191/c3_g1_i4/m.28004
MDQHPTSNDNDDCHHLQSTEECPQNRGGGSALSSNSPSDKEDSEAQHNNTNNTTQKTDDGSSSGESENDPTDAKKKRRRRRKRTRRKKQKKPGVPVDAVDLYRVFDTDMTTLYTIPHQLVSYTSGSDRYVRHDRTPNWLKKQIAEDENGGQPLRFYLCPAYAAAAAATAAATPTAKPQCASGRKCPHVHADVRCTTADDAPSAVVVETTHIHTKAQDMKGQTHARGTQIPIHDRGAGRVSEVASELVVRTKGSEDWFKTPSALRRRVYHCRHFSVEGVCLRGADCVFLHIVDVDPELPTANATASEPSPTLGEKRMSGLHDMFLYTPPSVPGMSISTPMCEVLDTTSPSYQSNSNPNYHNGLVGDDSLVGDDDVLLGHCESIHSEAAERIAHLKGSPVVQLLQCTPLSGRDQHGLLPPMVEDTFDLGHPLVSSTASSVLCSYIHNPYDVNVLVKDDSDDEMCDGYV